MFNFLISSEVKDDAAALRKISDIVFNKYSVFSKDELESTIRREFSGNNFNITSNEITISFNELKYFQFCFNGWPRNKASNLVIIGKGKYSGFMLQRSHNSNWHITLIDEVMFCTTAGAKTLAKLMEKKYDIFNFSNRIKR